MTETKENPLEETLVPDASGAPVAAVEPVEPSIQATITFAGEKPIDLGKALGDQFKAAGIDAEVVPPAPGPDPTPYPRMDFGDLSLGGSAFASKVPIAQDLQTRQAHIYDSVCGIQRHLNGAEGIPGFLGTVQILSTLLISRQSAADLEEQLPDIVERADRLQQLRTSLRDRLEEIKEISKALKSGTDEIGHIIFAINKLYGDVMRSGDAEKARRERENARREKAGDLSDPADDDLGDLGDEPKETTKPKRRGGKKAAATAEPTPPPERLAYDDPARPRLFSDPPIAADPRQTTIEDVIKPSSETPAAALPPMSDLLADEGDLGPPSPFDAALSAELDKRDDDRAPSSKTIGEGLGDDEDLGLDDEDDLDPPDPAAEGMIGDDDLDLDPKLDSDAPLADGLGGDEPAAEFAPDPLDDAGYDNEATPAIIMPEQEALMLCPLEPFSKISASRRKILGEGFRDVGKPLLLWSAEWEGRRSTDGTVFAGARVPFKWVKLIGDTLKAFALPYQIRTLDGKQPATLMRKGGRPVELPKILPE